MHVCTCANTYKHTFIAWNNATKSFNYCCAEYSLHFQCSFIFSISLCYLAIFINIYYVLEKKYNVLPHCFWKLMGHHWSVNHNPINITPQSLMKLSDFFFLNEASILHCFYTSFITGLLVVIFEWCSWDFILPKCLETQLLCKRPSGLSHCTGYDRHQYPTTFCRRKTRTGNWTRDQMQAGIK